MRAASRQQLMFVVVCLVWGSTWLAMKLGTVSVPPSMFSGLRWTLAGTILLGWVWFREGRLRVPWRIGGRVMSVSLLLITLNQALTLYSLRYVGSGLGSVINCALSPLSLLGFAVALRQERLTARVGFAMGLGVLGILALFGPEALAGRLDAGVMLGAFGIVLGTLTYSAGSVLARPMMGTMSPFLLAGMVNLAGGLILVACSLAFEPGAVASLDLRWGASAWAAWLFLLGPGSLMASTLFLMLVRDWGATKAGSYAFVSPIIAVLLGLVVSGETLHLTDAAGMALMLVAAWVALQKRDPV